MAYFFKALQVEETTAETFTRKIVTRSTTDLPEGEVLVRVLFSSLNYKDALSAAGNRGVTRRYPHTPGIDAAGVVIESRSPLWPSGKDVVVSCYDLGMNTAGGFGQYIRVPADWVMAKPEGMSLKETMAYGTAGFTAAQCVERLVEHPVQPADGRILVTGATGGVGMVAVALLARLGYQVTAMTGKLEKEVFLKELGAVEILPRDKAVDTSSRMLLKEKWAGVVDTVGGAALATAIKSTRYNGIITCCGNAASGDLPLNVYPFILRGVTLAGIDSAKCDMAQRVRVWGRLATEWKLPEMESRSTVIPLERLEETITAMLQGKHTGRTIVELG